jgi:hypothetical protein
MDLRTIPDHQQLARQVAQQMKHRLWMSTLVAVRKGFVSLVLIQFPAINYMKAARTSGT